MKVIFLGAGRFSASSFKSFLKHSNNFIEKVDILTNQKGKKFKTPFLPPIFLDSELERSSNNVTKFHCPVRSLNFPFNWSDYSVGIVSSFSLFIPPSIINQIPLINIHPSLLP